jgi:glycosyltransferase involved in cell wall biosynthesis
MRVAVDAHAIGQRLTGNEVYVRSLIGRYPRLDSDAEFITYIASREAVSWVPPSVGLRWVSKNPFVRLGGELSARLRADRPDLVHVQYTGPLFCPVPIVVTIHDVSFMEYPHFLPAPRAFQLQLSTRYTLKRAAKIITISEFSRQHIARVFNIDPDAIAVTPLAAQESFRVMNRELAARMVREGLGIERPYILHVGDLHPRKNQIGLIQAFRELLAAHPNLPHLLVLAGKHTWFAPKILEQVRRSGLEDRIVLPGFVEDDFLPALYNAAEVFVFPSFYEGFGLPVVEAMACGRPIVCSSATALPEVVDGAGLFFDPHNVGEQTRALRDILIDPELSHRMERKSLQRAAFYDWRETARQTLEVYHQVAEGRARLQRRKELVAR